MKVLQFVTRLDLGGAQECCLDQCSVLLAQGHEVHLLTAQGGELMPAALRMPGLAVHAWHQWHHAIRPIDDARCLFRLGRFLRDGRFDLIHTHCSKAGLIGRFAAWLAGAPLRSVHHIHGWSFNPTQRPWIRRAFILLEKIAARPGFILLACSEATNAQGRAAGIGNDADRRVLHYGIDRRTNLKRRDRDAVRRRLGLGRRDVLFVQLGNLKPQKDPVTFARAAVMAGRRLRRAHFWIAGDGPLRAAAEAIAAEGGLGKRFRILGWRRDVPEILAAADVLVLTSRFEGLPLAILRGMAAALPVVASSVDGTPEVVEDGVTGLLVGSGDARATAAALAGLGRDPALRRRMGRIGRDRSRRFSFGQAAAGLLDLYGLGRGTARH